MGTVSSKKTPLNNDVDASKTKRISFTPSLNSEVEDDYFDISDDGKKYSSIKRTHH